MKKILSLGIASAVLAMTALSASAAVTVKTDDQIKTGATITVTFTADGEIAAGGGVSFVVKASGVKLEKSTPSTAVLGSYGEATNKFGAVTMTAQPAGTVLLTQTYTVTAKANEAVSITVDSLDGFADANITAITTTVKADDNSGTNSGDNSGTNSGDNSGTNSGTNSGDTSSTTSTTNPSTNPNTGVALAVFPAVIAGAAVVVAKKKRG